MMNRMPCLFTVLQSYQAESILSIHPGVIFFQEGTDARLRGKRGYATITGWMCGTFTLWADSSLAICIDYTSNLGQKSIGLVRLLKETFDSAVKDFLSFAVLAVTRRKQRFNSWIVRSHSQEGLVTSHVWHNHVEYYQADGAIMFFAYPDCLPAILSQYNTITVAFEHIPCDVSNGLFVIDNEN